MVVNKLVLLRFSYWTGIILDGFATILLLSPKVAAAVFGLANINFGQEYLYASRLGAALMLGWTFLLYWADKKPIERKGVLLLFHPFATANFS